MTEPLDRLTSAIADRYRIERELGAGRHGHRLSRRGPEARPQGRDQGPAPRALRAVIGGDRFLAEIKITASLQHPHILGLIDSGER